jgi:hypothetical protein
MTMPVLGFVERVGQKTDLGGHALSMSAWAGIAYWAWEANERNIVILEERKARLREIREARETAANGGDSN